MDQHPSRGGGVEIRLVASCYGNRDKFRPDGPLGCYADLPFYFHFELKIFAINHPETLRD